MATKSKKELATKEAPKKRERYQERECPYCKKMVRNLPNHIRITHPGETGAEKPEPPEISKESLLGRDKPKQEPSSASNLKETSYYCQDCAEPGNVAKVRKGEEKCWRCGATLVWEGIS